MKLLKLLFPKQNYNVLSPISYTHISVRDLYISRISLPILLQEKSWEYSIAHRHMNVEIDRAIPRKGAGRRRGWWTGSRRSRCPYWATACERPTTSLPLLLPPAGWAQPGRPLRRPRPRRACARGRGRGWAAWRSGPWAGWGSGTCPS
jgi:hypothetical protein